MVVFFSFGRQRLWIQGFGSKNLAAAHVTWMLEHVTPWIIACRLSSIQRLCFFEWQAAAKKSTQLPSKIQSCPVPPQHLPSSNISPSSVQRPDMRPVCNPTHSEKATSRDP